MLIFKIAQIIFGWDEFKYKIEAKIAKTVFELIISFRSLSFVKRLLVAMMYCLVRLDCRHNVEAFILPHYSSQPVIQIHHSSVRGVSGVLPFREFNWRTVRSDWFSCDRKTAYKKRHNMDWNIKILSNEIKISQTYTFNKRLKICQNKCFNKLSNKKVTNKLFEK